MQGTLEDTLAQCGTFVGTAKCVLFPPLGPRYIRCFPVAVKFPIRYMAPEQLSGKVGLVAV